MNNQKFYHPKFFPTWLLIGLMKLGAKLPFKLQIILGKLMGMVLYLLLGRFRKIAKINISRCFPEKNKSAVRALVWQNFQSIGLSIFETSTAFFASNGQINQLFKIENETVLTRAIADKKSIILLSGHFTPLMLGGRALLSLSKIGNVYRPQNNPLFDEIMRKSYVENGAVMIKAKDTRGLLKALKNKLPIWYAPDQDLGLKNSVFAPFFNIQTATVTATARLAKDTNTVVIPFFFNRTKTGYIMRFETPIQDYPNADNLVNATLTNQILEAKIRQYPEQYLWIHRRFKTRPENEASFY
jgi:lipid A biosynthesis lauroyl/palmitoleoyl acyltransferase